MLYEYNLGIAIEFIPYNLIFCYYSKQDEFMFEMT